MTATMTKARRSGKVFLDWSQNSGSKTTISPYSLRGREKPYVATPLGWDEVEAGAEDPRRHRAAPVRPGAGAGGGVRRPVRVTPAGSGSRAPGRPAPGVTQPWCSRGPGVDPAGHSPPSLATRAARAARHSRGVLFGDRTCSAPGDPRRMAAARARTAGPRSRGAAGPAARSARPPALRRHRPVDGRLPGPRLRGAGPRGAADDLEVGDVITFRPPDGQLRRAGRPAGSWPSSDGLATTRADSAGSNDLWSVPLTSRRRTRGSGWACPGSATRS